MAVHQRYGQLIPDCFAAYCFTACEYNPKNTMQSACANTLSILDCVLLVLSDSTASNSGVLTRHVCSPIDSEQTHATTAAQ